MTKSEFLEQLEQKLLLISEQERKDILIEYGTYIDDKIANGASEKEAIQGFGDLDELAKEILEAYKINTDSMDSKADKTLDRAYSKTESFLNKFGNFSVNDIFHLIFDAFVLLILLYIGRILLIDICLNILMNVFNWIFGITYGAGIVYAFEDLMIWIFKLIYLAASILFFISVMSRRIRRIKRHDYRINVVEDLKQSFNKEAKDFLKEDDGLPPIPGTKPEKTLYHQRKAQNTDSGSLLIKIILALISFPTICCIIGFSIALIALFFVGVFEHVYSIGLILLGVGLLSGTISVQWFLIHLWPKKEEIPHA